MGEQGAVSYTHANPSYIYGFARALDWDEVAVAARVSKASKG